MAIDLSKLKSVQLASKKSEVDVDSLVDNLFAEDSTEQVAQEPIIKATAPAVPTPKEEVQPREDGFWNTYLGDTIEKVGAGLQNFSANTYGLLDKGARKINDLVGDTSGAHTDASGKAQSGFFGNVGKASKQGATDLRAKSDRYSGKKFTELWENDKAAAVGDVFLQASESLPQSLMAAFTGGAGLAAIGATAANEKYDTLDESNPNMAEVPKMLNALLTGTAEAGSEYLGSVPVGKWLKGMYSKVGSEAAQAQLQKGLAGWIGNNAKKLGVFFPPVAEGTEEIASQVAENITDWATGSREDFNPMEGVLESFVYGAGGGAQFSAMSLPAYGMRIADKVKTRNDLGKAERSFNSLFPGEYALNVMKGLNAMSTEEQTSWLEAVSQSTDYSEEQKKSAADLLQSNLSYNARRSPEEYKADKEHRDQMLVDTEMMNFDSYLSPMIAENGMIQQVKIGDEEVYITKGDILLTANEVGKPVFDPINSSDELYYTDKDGNIQVTSSKMVTEVLDIQDSEALREQRLQSVWYGIRQKDSQSSQMAQEVTIENGDPVQFLDPNTGQMVEGIAVDTALPDVIQMEDGRVIPREQVMPNLQSKDAVINPPADDTTFAVKNQNDRVEKIPPSPTLENNENALQNDTESTETVTGTSVIDYLKDKDGYADYDNIADPLEYAAALTAEYPGEELDIINQDLEYASQELESAKNVKSAIESRKKMKVAQDKIDRLNSFKAVFDTNNSVIDPLEQADPLEDDQESIQYIDLSQLSEPERRVHISQNSNDPLELADLYDQVKDEFEVSQMMPWEAALVGRKISKDSFIENSDKNNVTGAIAKSWFADKDHARKAGLDVIAAELSEYGTPVTENDIVEFVLSHPNNNVKKTNQVAIDTNRRFKEVVKTLTGENVGGLESTSGKLVLAGLKAGVRSEQEKQAQPFNSYTVPDAVLNFFEETGLNPDDFDSFEALNDAISIELKKGTFVFPLGPNDLQTINNIVQHGIRQQGNYQDFASRVEKAGAQRTAQQPIFETAAAGTQLEPITGADTATTDTEGVELQPEIIPEESQVQEDESKASNDMLAQLLFGVDSINEAEALFQEQEQPEELEYTPEEMAEIDAAVSDNRPLMDVVKEAAQSHEITEAEKQVNIDPTEAQKEAGNYKMGHVSINGFDVTIENPKGSTRSGVDADGKPWSIDMANSYGYIKGTKGKDGDHVDVFVVNSPLSDKVFVVDQINKDGSFDEHKVMMGFNSIEEAQAAYLANYEQGWTGLGNITEMPADEFRAWVKDGVKSDPVVEVVEEQAKQPALTIIEEAREAAKKLDAKVKKQPENLPNTPVRLKTSPYSVDGVDHETPIVLISKTIKKDVDNFAKALAKQLGWEHKKDKKGKAVYSITNIAPAGGTVTFDLTKPGTDVAVRVNVNYQPDYDRYYDNYKVADVIWGVSEGGKVVNNRISDAGISSQELSDAISIATKKYVSRVEPKVQQAKTALEVAKEEAKKLDEVKPEPTKIDVEGVFGALSTKGKAKLSDHAVKDEAKAEPKMLVSDERKAELVARLKAKMNNLNAGIDPEMFAMGIELAVYHIERGARKFADYAKEMINDLGDEIRPRLKQFYNGVKNDPDYSILEPTMDSDEFVRAFDVMSFVPVASLPNEGKRAFVDAVKEKLGKDTMNIVSLRKLAAENGLVDVKDTTIQEYVELALIEKAKDIVSENIPSEKKYKKIVDLYNSQPTISMRSSERVEKQQYSTPLPISFLAGEYINASNPERVLEPSSGNGMMVFNVPTENVIANEIDVVRLDNLREQPFMQVMNQDGTAEFNIDPVDAVVMNPPFGKSEARDYNGYKIAGLDEQMVVNALLSMKPDGKASIIIGGHTKYKENGTLASEKAFFDYLYNHYNVVDVVNIDGSLYSKQGTSFPVRLILINGQRTSKEKTYAPLKKNANADAVVSFNQLYNRVNEKINEKDLLLQEPTNTDNDGVGVETGNVNGRNVGEGDNSISKQSSKGGRKPSTSSKGPNLSSGLSDTTGRTSSVADADGRDLPHTPGRERRGDVRSRQGVDPRVRRENVLQFLNRTDEPGGIDVKEDAVKVDINSEKTPYPAKSKSTAIGSVVPTNVAQSLAKVLSQFKDVDAYVQTKLGYPTKDDLYNALAAEQIDSVAMAIYQIEQNKALIIGDMTGVGKGRQAAAIIRYATLQGKKPIFITEKAHLFSDMYRDLRDIGSASLVPFILNSKSANSDPTITDETGEVIYKPLSDAKKASVLKNGSIPEDFDYAMLTYSQMNTDSKKGSVKKEFISNIASDNIIVMDESHNAGGSGNTGEFIKTLLPSTKGVVFLSGTFAKRPDNMPIYALKTSMSEANMSNDELIEAISKGGIPLQEIMSKNLVEAGQMVRRERDFTGVSIDWLTLDESKDEHYKVFDGVIELFNDLITYQREHITPWVEEVNEAIAESQSSADIKNGTKDFGISNTPFASKTFNVVRQLLFSLKAADVARYAIEELKAGRKPVIAVANTMEGFMNELGAIGQVINNYDFSATLKRGLDGLFRYTEMDSSGKPTHKMINIKELPVDAQERYDELVKQIESFSSGITISPIDVIRDAIEKAGYRVGELTGRTTQINFNADGTAVIEKRTDTDKKKLARDFNSGDLDVLILNQSASTGISLHASSKFNDKKPRVMISAQTQLDVNTEVQMRGRIDRTGQVHRGAYKYICSPIPAEMRLTMMFKAKLKSLDANTTSNQKSKSNEIDIVDFLNKYGDEVCIEYLKDNPDVNEKLLDPMKMSDKSESELERYTTEDGAASKIAGRVALLSVKEQDMFYKEVSEKYTNVLNYLNDNNSNDLEITTLPLRAETKGSVVVVQGLGTEGNPFAQDSVRETVEVDVLKKPMKADEVKKEMERLTDGASQNQYRSKLVDEINEAEKAEIRAEREKAKLDFKEKSDALRAKKQKDGAKKGLSGDILESYIMSAIDEASEKYDESLTLRVKKIGSRYQSLRKIFNMLPVGRTLMIPNSLNIGPLTTYTEGVLMGYKMKKGKYSPSAITASFATLDSRRKVDIPLSKFEFINAVYSETSQNLDFIKTDLSNWDEKIPTKTRRTGYIVTGNVLQAYGVTEGQLVSYSTVDGDIRQGILLPESYKPETQKMRVKITESLPELLKGNEVIDSTGEVKIEKENRSGYSISVPVSKAKGGKYFLDAGLRSFVMGEDFRQMGNKMVGAITERNIENALKYLSDKFGLTSEVTLKGGSSSKADKDNVRFRDSSSIVPGIAPNGKKSNLSNKQWNEVRSNEFKEWFGDWENNTESASKTLDENGEPMVVYRGHDASQNSYSTKLNTPTFTSSKEAAQVYSEDHENGVVTDAFVNAKNPLSLGDEYGSVTMADLKDLLPANVFETIASSGNWKYSGDYATFEDVVEDAKNNKNALEEAYTETFLIADNKNFVEWAQSQGYDSFMYKGFFSDSNNLEDDFLSEIRPFNENQIKSASSDGVSDVEEEVAALSKSLNTPIRIVRDVNELTDNNKGLEKRMRSSKGWFDTNTNEVVLVLPNAESVADAQSTVLHEAVGHMGLRKLLGRDFTPTMESIFDSLPKDLQAALKQKYGSKVVSAEEYASTMAETMSDPGIIQRIVSAFKDAMRKIGFNLKMTDGDIMNLLWKSKNKLTDGDTAFEIMGKMSKAESVKKETESFDRVFRDSATLNDTMDEMSDDPVIKAEMHASIKSKSFQWQEGYQDRMLAVKKLQELLEKHTGKKLPDHMNVYIFENTLSSRNTYEIEQYKELYTNKMMENVKAFISKGYSMPEVENYVIAKHGLERNDYFRINALLDEVNALEKNDAYLEWLPDAIRSNSEKFQARVAKDKAALLEEIGTRKFSEIEGLSMFPIEKIRQRLAKRDFAGITALEKELEMSAQEYIDITEGRFENETKELWKSINAATKASLKKWFDSGMINKEVYNKINGMYEYYVPLRGFAEDTAADVYEYFTEQVSPFNNPLKKAYGRKSKPETPFAHIVSAAGSSIVGGNKNIMKLHLLRLAQNNPSDYMTVNKAWYVDNGKVDPETNKPIYDAVFPEYSENMDEYRANVEEFEAEMEELKAQGIAFKGTKKLKPGYKISKVETSEHMVRAMLNGEEHFILVHGDPRVAQAVNGLNDTGRQESKFMKTVAWGNRQMAANFTTRNPSFIASNLVRDVVFASTALSVKEGSKYTFKFEKNVFGGKAGGALGRFLKGKPNYNNEADVFLKEFLENGGETGYTALYNIDKYKKMIARSVEVGTKASIKDSYMNVVDIFSNGARWAEDLSRFSVYMTSRQSGRTILKSVNDAKEVTVNFNRKGSGSHGAGFARGAYLFFNAAIQSLSNAATLVKKEPVKASAAMLGFASVGYLIPVIVSMLGDDDDLERYNNLPDYVRKNHLCIPMGDGFVKIPLPIELRAFYGLGDQLYRMATGSDHMGESLLNMALSFMDMLPLNPVGGGDTLGNLLPDALVPVYQSYGSNKDFTGKPIARVTPFNEFDPEYLKVYKNANVVPVYVSQLLNSVSGGDDVKKGGYDKAMGIFGTPVNFSNPAAFEHLFESYFGGLWSTTNQLMKTAANGVGIAKDIATGEDNFDWSESQGWRTTPILNRFIDDGKSNGAMSKINDRYFKAVKEMKETKYLIRGYEEKLDSNLSVIEAMKVSSKIAELESGKAGERMYLIEDYTKDIESLNKESQDVPKDRRSEIVETMNDLKSRMLEKLKEIDNRN